MYVIFSKKLILNENPIYFLRFMKCKLYVDAWMACGAHDAPAFRKSETTLAFSCSV